ncbi:hypothetical protein [Actinoplanes cyaneus]|uniref:hypothetical protein n=1 Tax=Actinoplanes cyaneus TaxID=52696 RepID=UPI0019411F5E|nr:hypothetical protein [Actinoplanes cyaneus]MCW2143043.1 hypothetical protein [Actinoplanes cyaneus]
MRLLLSFAVAAVLGVTGALLGSAPMAAVGCLGVLAVLAVHPWTRAAPVPVRLALWAGLLLLGVVVGVHVSSWPDPMTGSSDPVTGATPEEILARLTEPSAAYRRYIAVSVALGLACACFGGALVPVARRRDVRALLLPAAGVALLGVLCWQAADAARRNRPRPVERGTFVSVLAIRDTEPHVQSAVGAGLLVLSAAGAVLGAARRDGR